MRQQCFRAREGGRGKRRAISLFFSLLGYVSLSFFLPSCPSSLFLCFANANGYNFGGDSYLHDSLKL
jgi:hypothetical protein